MAKTVLQQLASTIKRLKDEVSRLKHEAKDSIKAQRKLHDAVSELKEELAEAQADALDQLNDRAEVVAELMKRAAPEGWEVRSTQRPSKGPLAMSLSAFALGQGWRWCLKHRNGWTLSTGDAKTLPEAAKAAEVMEAEVQKREAKRKARR